MLLQLAHDLVHVGLRPGGLDPHGLHLVAGLLEKAEDAPLVLLVLAEVLQLHHQVGQGLPDLAQVLVAHVAQGALREARYALLGGGPVLEHQLGVGDVDLLCELVHHLPLRLGEHALVDLHRLRFGLLRLCGGGGGGLGLHAQGQPGGLHLGGLGVQRQFGHHAVHITHCRFLRLFQGFFVLSGF